MNKPQITKIAVVVPKYGLVGGGERFVYELTERLAETGQFDIHVFANQWRANSSRLTFHKVPIIRFPKWLTTISFALFANWKIAIVGGFDLIHTHERIFKADICSMHFIPHRLWVKGIRGKKNLSLFDYATCWVEKRMFSNPQCYFMPVSFLAQQKMQEVYQVRAEKIKVVHPGIDSHKCNMADPLVRQTTRAEFGCGDNDFIILFVSMNFELKGLDRLMAAVGGIKDEFIRSRVKILIVGKGNKKKFQILANNLDLDGQVIFAGVRHDMNAIYQAGDILVLLSGFDTFGMVVTEAMASSLPVIVSDKVGAADLIKDGENGFVVDRQDIAQISRHIAELVRHTDQRLEMGQKARKASCASSWENVATLVSNIYDKKLGLP